MNMLTYGLYLFKPCFAFGSMDGTLGIKFVFAWSSVHGDLLPKEVVCIANSFCLSLFYSFLNFFGNLSHS